MVDMPRHQRVTPERVPTLKEALRRLETSRSFVRLYRERLATAEVYCAGERHSLRMETLLRRRLLRLVRKVWLEADSNAKT